MGFDFDLFKWRLFLIALALLGVILALLAPMLGLEGAFDILIGFAAGAVASFAASMAVGSASPRLILISLTNSSDRKVMRAIAKRLNPESPPQQIDEVEPGGETHLVGTYPDPLIVGVRTMQVEVTVEDEGGVVETATLEVSVSDMAHRAEAFFIQVTNEHLRGVLTHRANTDEPEVFETEGQIDWP